MGNKTVVTVHPNALVRGGSVGVGTMYIRPQEKSYRMVYDKRQILPGGINTVPLGWLG